MSWVETRGTGIDWMVFEDVEKDKDQWKENRREHEKVINSIYIMKSE